MASCLYAGRVDHTRASPRRHSFHYRLLLMYLELDSAQQELARFPRLLGTVFSPLRFRWQDHLGSAASSPADAARDLVARHVGERPTGPVRLLTGFGFMAWRFNPVSFYYCFDGADRCVQAVIAEVTNTPWRERHYYVLDFRHQAGEKRLHCRHGKQFHVSPFMPMDTEYQWQLETPRDKLTLTIGVNRGGEPLFGAGLQLQRRDFSRIELLKGLACMPFTTVKVVAAIHWQALRLWLKGAPVHGHPGHPASAATGVSAHAATDSPVRPSSGDPL